MHPLLVALIVAYVIFNAYWMLPFWIEYWNLDLSWISFIVWCIPLLFYATSPNPYLLILALAVSFFGKIGDLNIATSYALALALGSFLPWSWLTAFWILCGIAWSPSFSWIIAQFNSHYQSIRIVIAGIPVMMMLYQKYFKRNQS